MKPTPFHHRPCFRCGSPTVGSINATRLRCSTCTKALAYERKLAQRARRDADLWSKDFSVTSIRPSRGDA